MKRSGTTRIVGPGHIQRVKANVTDTTTWLTLGGHLYVIIIKEFPVFPQPFLSSAVFA